MFGLTRFAIFGLLTMCGFALVCIALNAYRVAWWFVFFIILVLLLTTTVPILKILFPNSKIVAPILYVGITVGWFLFGIKIPFYLLKQIEVQREICGQVILGQEYSESGGRGGSKYYTVFEVKGAKTKVFKMQGIEKRKMIRKKPSLCITYFENENWSDYPFIVSYEINEKKNERKHIH
ncbi:hypothetical protein SAMN05421749_1154 [Acinetobacter marinus]|uniref:Uncharacterized protein n=1 Tax=Acinetobacter marinus TaxID=281375 RepID=A0A1G6PF96_9GAMM|nr:hypothetical protein [Acinetobacter marinus]SDC78234.1 hypothetical protein SAMN05421749_1154 [Acinetobacter marinus]